jgi:hypothetical protein
MRVVNSLAGLKQKFFSWDVQRAERNGVKRRRAQSGEFNELHAAVGRASVQSLLFISKAFSFRFVP